MAWYLENNDNSLQRLHNVCIDITMVEQFINNEKHMTTGCMLYVGLGYLYFGHVYDWLNQS